MLKLWKKKPAISLHLYREEPQQQEQQATWKDGAVLVKCIFSWVGEAGTLHQEAGEGFPSQQDLTSILNQQVSNLQLFSCPNTNLLFVLLTWTFPLTKVVMSFSFSKMESVCSRLCSSHSQCSVISLREVPGDEEAEIISTTELWLMCLDVMLSLSNTFWLVYRVYLGSCKHHRPFWNCCF